MSHPKVLAALMALDEGSRTQKILEDDFSLFAEILRGTLLQIIVEFGEINVRNTTSENAIEVDTKNSESPS